MDKYATKMTTAVYACYKWDTSVREAFREAPAKQYVGASDVS